MKRIIKKVALSGAAMAFLVAAMLQVAGPTGVRAQEGPNDDGCLGVQPLCSVVETTTCVLWVFCVVSEEYFYYDDVFHTH